MSSNEYSGNMVGSTCSYKSLCNYNASMGVPIPQGVPDMSVQLIPEWSYPPSYSSLTHGNKPYSCGGKFTLRDSYPCSHRDKSFKKRCCLTSKPRSSNCWDCGK